MRKRTIINVILHQNAFSIYIINRRNLFIFLPESVLPKKQRLTARDVLFLSKKRQFLPAGFFGFFYIQQYSNLEFNQFSIHVSIKYAKHSVIRNNIKRAVFTYLKKEDIAHKKLAGKHYKVFIILNKTRIPELQKYFANKAKKDIFVSAQQLFEQNFIYFVKKLSGKE